MSDTTVSCNNCGVVVNKKQAAEQIICPVCEISGPHRTMPRVGEVRKWWSEVNTDE